MVFLTDNGVAGRWATALCRDTACITIKPLFARLLVSASLCIVLIESSRRPGQSWPRPLRLPALHSHTALSHFMSPALLLFVCLPEVFGNHFPWFSLSHFLSPPFYSFPNDRVFHLWCDLNDSPAVWQWFNMSQCYINPLSSRMLKAWHAG